MTKQYRTGDGKRFATKQEAIAHANRLADRKNIIVAVERIARKAVTA